MSRHLVQTTGNYAYGLNINTSSGATTVLPLRLTHDNSEIFRINDAGNVGIGTTDPDEKLVVVGSTTGKYTSSGWTHSSDRRLKKEIEPLDFPLEKILQLEPVSYIFRADEEEVTQVGFIAQDVEPLFPEVVKTDNEGFKSMVYANLISPLIKAFKEFYGQSIDSQEAQNRKIASLTQENQDQENQINDLKAENQEIKKQLDQIKSLICSSNSSAELCN